MNDRAGSQTNQLDRRLGRWASALAVALGALISESPASATGALSTPGIEPVEQRVAIALGKTHTTLWTSLSFDGPPGKLAVVLPVPVGTALDTSSRAFFEALQVATAPRVVPPKNGVSVCPGDSKGPGVALDGDLVGMAPLSPQEVLTLADAGALESWAAANGLVVSQSTLSALATFDASTRFVVMRYDAPGGIALTKTLRAVLPGLHPVAPLVLSAAKSSGLRVVTWEIGPGRSHVGGTEVEVDLDNLAFDVDQDTSNYGALRSGLLVDFSKVLVESTSHESLRDNLAIGTTSESVAGFVKTYFARAKSYGDVIGDDIACTFDSAVILGQPNTVSEACPRADLGFVEVGASCVENVATGEVDPAKLRCGGVSDDLSMMLSGLAGKEAWLTRSTLLIPAGKLGADLLVTFPTGLRVDPIYEATSTDLSGCGGGSSSSTSTGASMGSGPPPTSSTGSGGVVEVPLYQYNGCSCNGAYDRIGYVEVDTSNAPDAYYETPSGCSSDTSSNYSTTADNCSGDTSTSGDSCGSSSGSSTASSDSCSGSDTSSGCAGDGSTSGDTCGSGSTDGCGSSSGSSDSCSNDCAVARQGHPGKVRRIAPRLSGLVYALVIVLIPLRRFTRPKKSKRRQPARGKRRQRA